MLSTIVPMWVAACSKGTGGGAATTTVMPATPTAVSFPTRAISAAEEIIVTATVESGQEPSLPLRLPQELNDEEKVATTDHFDMYAVDGFFPVRTAEWKVQVETIYDDVSEQLGTNSDQRMALSFHPPVEQPCPARGLTILNDLPQIIIFADDATSQAQLQGVIAHEAGHVLLQQGFDPPLSADRALNEGLATWAARQYWNAWHGWPSLAAAVQSFREDSRYLPLYENTDLSDVYLNATRFGDECLNYRDILYTEWAAFEDYLIQEQGLESLVALFGSAIPEAVQTDAGEEVMLVKSPDYQAIYGQALNQLETAWLESLAESD